MGQKTPASVEEHYLPNEDIAITALQSNPVDKIRENENNPFNTSQP